MLAPFSLSLSLSLVPCPGDEEGGSDGLNYGRRKESTLKRQRRESDVIRKKKKEEEKAASIHLYRIENYDEPRALFLIRNSIYIGVGEASRARRGH